MCGFVGAFINTNGLREELLLELSRMAEHRGPDDTGFWSDDEFKVAFNRLSIIELTTAGHQPMISSSGDWVIVFNGEIYNHLALRIKLPNFNYKGRSDTETIVWAIESWGVERTLKELNGMFAIAAYNKVEKTLWLARDFAGIKPLFYSTGTKNIWFASQFNQVIEGLGKKNVTLSKNGMRDFLQLGYMQSPETVYQEIKQVLPGEVIKINHLKKKTHKRFYELSKTGNLENNVQQNGHREFSELMNEVVGDQMLSDVMLGSFISSGIDSTLVAGFASRINKNIKTFTIGAKDYAGNETAKAGEYSKELNLEHKSQVITEKEILCAVDESIKFQSEPFGDYSSIPTFIITKYAKENSTVMLSGDGGDELFWGYPRWNTFIKHYESFKFTINIRRLQAFLMRKIGIKVVSGPTTLETPGEWVLNSHSHISTRVMKKIMPEVENTGAVKDLYDFPYGPTKLEFRNWLRWNEFYAHLQRVLIKVDRMSMANSLEVRVPFLDKRIIEFAWNQNSSYGLTHFVNKEFLKQQLSEFIPEVKINYKKLGFSVPIGKWLRGPLKPIVLEKLLDSEFYGKEYVNKHEIEKYVKDFYSGNHESDWGIWILYTWQKWGDYMNS